MNPLINPVSAKINFCEDKWVIIKNNTTATISCGDKLVIPNHRQFMDNTYSNMTQNHHH